MSIILELQSDIISNNTDVLPLLRKALLISTKLSLLDFEEWVNNELNGYKGDVPDYRKVKGELKAYNPYRGWIPVSTSEEIENLITNRLLTNSISHLLSLLESDHQYFMINCSTQECNLFNSFASFQTTYRLEFPVAFIYNVIDQIKNTILNWTLVLEEKGILGEGLTFTASEKEIAQKESQIINYITNIYGDVTDTQIQQGTIESEQTK